MNKPIKYLLFGVGGFIALILAIVAVVAATFNPNDYKPLVVKLVQEKKQRTLHIDGDIKLAFWPKIGADLGKISISEHNSDKEFAAVDGLKVSLALLPLLKKQLVVDTVYVDGARANIVRHKDGTTNFDDLLSKDEQPSEIKFDIDGVKVTNSSLSFSDEKAVAKYDITKFNLNAGHVALQRPFDAAADFVLVATNPKINANANIKGNFMADPEAKHFVANDLDAAIKGDFAGGTDMDIKLSGDVDAKPENLEFLVDGLKLVFSGKFNGAKLAADLDMPKLVLQKDQFNGKEAKLNLSQEKGSNSLQAKLILADIKGSPDAFQSGGIKAEIDAKQGKDSLHGKFALADIKGSLKAVQSSGITGDFTAKQGARDIDGKFSSPFSANLDTLVFDLPKLAGNLGVKDPALPNGAMKGDFALQLHADVKQQLVNSLFNLHIDNTNLKGDMAVASFAKPNIKFSLTADQLDLNKLLGHQAASADAKTSAADKPADLSALKSLLMQGSVNVGSIAYDKYRIANLLLGIKADGEKLNINPFSLKLDDSQIKGSLGISHFAKPLYSFDIDIDKIDANRYVSQAPANSTTAAPKDDKPLDMTALKALNADGSLRIGALKYGKIQSSNIRIDLKADGEKLSLSPLAAKVDDSQIQANLAISRFANPVYSFNINIDKLDADRYITKGEAQPAQAKPNPDAPVDLSALKKLNASGEANIGWLKLANVKTSNVHVKLQAENGIAELAPFSANLYEGSMAGSLKVDARNMPIIAFKQDMKGIAIGPLLVDAINNDMLSGKGTLNVDVTTQGATVGALKKALNGKAAVNLADGAVKGIDIAGTLRGVKDKLNVLKSQSSVEGDKTKKTDFSEMVATFNIKNGVAHNDDLSMKAPLFRITGSGDIDIGNETINYLAKPTVVNSLKGQGGADLEAMNGLTIPIKLTGTFTKPSYAIDFAGLATAMAKNKLLEGVGGTKGDAVKNLVGGNKEDALKSLLGGKNKATPATAPAAPASTEVAPTAPASGEPTPVPPAAPAEKPKATPEEKAKKKLNKLLGL